MTQDVRILDNEFSSEPPIFMCVPEATVIVTFFINAVALLTISVPLGDVKLQALLTGFKTQRIKT